MPIQTAEQARRVFKTPRDLTRTDAGRVRSKITDLQRQTNLNKDETSRLKELRRDWNRNLKYTREGMALSGATSPLDAQNRFMRSTEDFRQINPQAYGRMYPFSQTAMKLGESGGLMGLGIRALTGQLGEWGKGLTSLVDSDKDEQDEYIAKTFGPNFYPKDVHPGSPIDDVPLLVDEEPVLTREDEIRKVIEKPGIQLDPEFLFATPKTEEEDMVWSNVPEDVEPLPFDEGKEDFIRRQNEYVSPAPLEIPNPQGDFDRFNKYLTPNISVEFGEQDEIPSLPPYQGREFGLGQFMNRMPRDWQDYLEDVGRLGDMPGGHLTYDEWHDSMRRRR